MQIDISMTVISLLLSSDLAADSFFVLVRTYQLRSKTYFILKFFPHTLLKSLIVVKHSRIRGTQREHSSKPLKQSIVKRILVLKR